ncbi:RagB/SusD family nutrient uptake outer membrane protein, partial [termite gut metagenome]
AGVAANNNYSNLDIVLYRYADVILSLAEAIVMKPEGSVTEEAIDLMNLIRKRANLDDKKQSDFPTKEAFIDQLLTERSHEFWCENGQYRADLIRFDKLYDRVMSLNSGIAPYANKDKYLFPLPLSVIVDGKGMVIQNKGYGN